MTERLPDIKPTIYTAGDSNLIPCSHINHTADMRGLRPGRYRHTCPACGKSYTFEIFPEGPQWAGV